MKTFLIILLVCTGLIACSDNTSTERSPRNKTYGDFRLRNHLVYCGRQLITQANPSQFKYIGSHYIDYEAIHYAKDNKYVYTCDVRKPTIFSPAKPNAVIMMTLKGIDPASFVLLEKGYAKDAKTVLYGNKKVVGANAEKFRILKNFYQAYVFDGKYIYHNNRKLPVKDPLNFKLLGGIFATDNHHVYANRTRITINPHKAIVMTYRLIRDDKNVYYRNKRIKGAHACSFTPGGEAEDSMDKDHFYYEEGRWKLDNDSKRHQFKREAHSKWRAYYAEYRKTNKGDCPKKHVLIPRNKGEIQIINIQTVK